MIRALCTVLVWTVATGHKIGEADDAVIRSGVKEGRSSSVFFPTALRSHKLAEAELKASTGSSRILRGEDSDDMVKKNIGSFLDSYGPAMGVRSGELRDTKDFADPGAAVTYYHYEQVVGGYKVLGGDMSVTVGVNRDVLAAKGHPLSEEAQRTLQPLVDETLDLRSKVMSYMRRVVGNSEVNYDLASCPVWDSEIVWYRTMMHAGGTGDVFLVHHVKAHCDFGTGDYMFQMFGKRCYSTLY